MSVWESRSLGGKGNKLVKSACSSLLYDVNACLNLFHTAGHENTGLDCGGKEEEERGGSTDG